MDICIYRYKPSNSISTKFTFSSEPEMDHFLSMIEEKLIPNLIDEDQDEVKCNMNALRIRCERYKETTGELTGFLSEYEAKVLTDLLLHLDNPIKAKEIKI